MEKGLTQTDLATLIDSTQRNISHYETIADYPPTDVLVKLASALKVSIDDLLGIKAQRAATPRQDPELRRLWKKFQQIMALPEKDRRAVIRLVNSLVATRPHARP